LPKKLASLKIQKSLLCEQDELKVAANAFFASQQIGAVQVCYNLLNLEHVISSRKVENANPLPRSELFTRIVTNKHALSHMNPTDSAAASSGPTSTLGKRNAYHELVKQQWATFGKCEVTLYALLTSFTFHESTKAESRSLSPPPYIQLTDSGTLLTTPIFYHKYTCTGFISHKARFRLEKLTYSVRRKQAVINMSPHIAYNPDNEKSCFAILLLHTPRTPNGEAGLVSGCSDAISKLQSLSTADKLPRYLLNNLRKQQISTNFLSNQGTPSDNQHSDDECQISNDDDSDSSSLSDTSIFQNAALEKDVPHDVQKEDLFDCEKETNTVNINNETILNIRKKYEKCRNFIDKQRQFHLDAYYKANQIQQMLSSGNQTQKQKYEVDNYVQRLDMLRKDLENLNHPSATHQKDAYNKIISHLTGGTKDQLRMFLSGEGGTGKSKVLKLVMELARLHYGRTEGLHGPVLAMGPTGPSSHNIKGFTYHSVVGLSSSSTKAHKITQMTAKAKGETIRGVKLFIIDEISLVGKEDLGILEQRLKASFLTTIQDPIERDARKHLPFAGVHFILCGDFYQLPPVFNKIPLYSPLFSEGIKHVEKKKLQMAGQDVWQSINAFSELIFNFRKILIMKVQNS
jgi:hypothetical protein